MHRTSLYRDFQVFDCNAQTTNAARLVFERTFNTGVLVQHCRLITLQVRAMTTTII